MTWHSPGPAINPAVDAAINTAINTSVDPHVPKVCLHRRLRVTRQRVEHIDGVGGDQLDKSSVHHGLHVDLYAPTIGADQVVHPIDTGACARRDALISSHRRVGSKRLAPYQGGVGVVQAIERGLLAVDPKPGLDAAQTRGQRVEIGHGLIDRSHCLRALRSSYLGCCQDDHTDGDPTHEVILGYA